MRRVTSLLQAIEAMDEAVALMQEALSFLKRDPSVKGIVEIQFNIDKVRLTIEPLRNKLLNSLFPRKS